MSGSTAIEAQPQRISQQLCTYLAELRYEDMPQRVVHEGRRGVLDWLGCALAGSTHPTIDLLIGVQQEIGSLAQATVIGRKLKLGLLDTALANGQIGHVLDYDDTHIAETTVMHTSSPLLAAMFALSEREKTNGRDFLLAYAAGFEVGIRSGLACPHHQSGGWHMTATLGTLAVGAAAGKLMRLDAAQLEHAIAISATQAAGLRNTKGSMCKSFHAGKAAMNGLLAALLARRGFDSPQDIAQHKQSFCHVYSDVAVPQALVADLGQRWELARNGHKPYACGVVLHAAIDAVLALRAQTKIDPARVSEIGIIGHPHVLSVTGVADPAHGLQSKFSINHSAAVALIDGAAQIPQYTDQRALDPAVIALRKKVTVKIDESLHKDQARAFLIMDGTRYESVIEHASGSMDHPMSDNALEAKFMANAEPVVGKETARRIADLAWKLDALDDVSALCDLYT